MTGPQRIRMAGTRRVGLALAGVLAVGLAAASGTAFASSGSPAAGTSGMAQMASMSSGHARTGFTKGWYDGRTVRFFYSKNFSCKEPPASMATSKCEAGGGLHADPRARIRPAVRGRAARLHAAEVHAAVPGSGPLH